MADNSSNQMAFANTVAWIQGGGQGVKDGDCEPGTIAHRVINLDRQLTGADGQTVNLVQHVLNLSGQVGALISLVGQLAAGKGSAVVIDYDRIARDIAANMPSFEVTPKAGK